MNVLVCVKQVPDIGSKFTLTLDKKIIDASNLGFTISPHEECAVEEAISIIEKYGGDATVLTLGPSIAEEQLRNSMARGMNEAILMETKLPDWDPIQTANAIIVTVKNIEENSDKFDLLMFGNESADSGNAQVGIRVAHGLGLPCICGVKNLDFRDSKIVAKRDILNGMEIYETTLPAVVTIKEGLNLPRYPSLRGRIKSRKKKLKHFFPNQGPFTMEMIQLKHPKEYKKKTLILGKGAEAAAAAVDVIKELKLIK